MVENNLTDKKHVDDIYLISNVAKKAKSKFLLRHILLSEDIFKATGPVPPLALELMAPVRSRFFVIEQSGQFWHQRL